MAVFVLDRTSILDRLGGDEEIYSIMVDVFIQDVDGNCAALAAALQSGDARLLQREAHTVKGLFATFSDDLGAADALALESRAKEGLLVGLEAAVERIRQRLQEVKTVLLADLAAR